MTEADAFKFNTGNHYEALSTTIASAFDHFDTYDAPAPPEQPPNTARTPCTEK